MGAALTGRTIALAEGRQIEELAQMLEMDGAAVVRCPMISILDVEDERPVVDWLRDLIADRFSHVVLMTGEGVRRLLGFAERAGLHDAAIASLGRTRLVVRGPKPTRALKEIGVVPAVIAAAPTTAGVIESLRSETLEGCTIGVQLFGKPNPEIEQFLKDSDAIPVTVMPYIYAPAADGDRVADLIARLAHAQIDALVFTSSPQVDRLFEVTEERQLQSQLAAGLNNTCVAAVGPIVADNLRRRGSRVDVCPEQGFVMKNLVKQLKDALHR